MAHNQQKKLRIIPLGGLDEIGKNMTVLEYGEDMIVIDCGLGFPDEEMPGIDLVIPDMSYVEENYERLRGFVITHGHEDHIGALPFALQNFNVPVYGTKFTLALIEHKLAEHKVKKADLRCVTAGEVVELGCFKIEFVKVGHSIAGAVALAITTPAGVIIHTGDFKVDFTPIDNEPIDVNRFAHYGSKGVLVLMMDSTNAELSGFTPSEKEIGKTFEKVFDEAKGRVIVASFASNVYRIQQVADIAIRHGRVICLQGRSMIFIARKAMELGYLQIPEDRIVDIETLKQYPDNEACVLTTGSQGEHLSGLFRMANSNHKLNIGEGDTVIISASAIPGNEKAVGKVINQLFQRGANVVYDRLADVHVSGHARSEELRLMFRLIKPKCFIPIHGETRHLHHHAQIAAQMGMDSSRIFIMETGNVLELGKRGGKIVGNVASGSVLVDGSGIGDIGTEVLKERRVLSQDGMFAIVIAIKHKTGELAAEPQIISHGFVYTKDSEELLEDAKAVAVSQALRFASCDRSEWGAIKNSIKSDVRSFLRTMTKRTPLIMPIVLEVD